MENDDSGHGGSAAIMSDSMSSPPPPPPPSFSSSSSCSTATVPSFVRPSTSNYQASPIPAPASPPPPPTTTATSSSSSAPFTFCVECEDQSAEVTCLDCMEEFCRPCWSSQHRKGKRAAHCTQAILGEMMAAPEVPEEPVEAAQGGRGGGGVKGEEGAVVGMMLVGDDEEGGGEGSESVAMSDEAAAPRATTADAAADRGSSSSREQHQEDEEDKNLPPGWLAHYNAEISRLQANYEERPWARKRLAENADYCPLRLTATERRLLGVLESALNVSEYTDNVDAVRRGSRPNRMAEEVEHLFATILGLIICADPPKGRDLVKRPIGQNGDFFRSIFEVGRRYKVMNPDKFRGGYGKLMYMLQDTQGRALQDRIGFGTCVKALETVGKLVKERGKEAFLLDPRVVFAARDVTMGMKEGKEGVKRAVWMKKRAGRELKKSWACPEFTEEEIQRVLDSMADGNNYLTFNSHPVRRMLWHLQQNFDADVVDAGFSLAIGGGGGGRVGGRGASFRSGIGEGYGYGGGYGSSYFRGGEGGGGGAKLSHDHATHFTYVWQSLKLWREIMQNMFRLWYLADQDLLAPSTATSSYMNRDSYHLLNTGQGLNRVQHCPAVAAEMRSILHRVQRECGSWVGLSVVHLGDRDVPNALMFIDKYTQVPRILSPINKVIEECLAAAPEKGTQVEDEDEDMEEGEKNGLKADHNHALAAYATDVWGDGENLKMHILVDFFKRAFDGDGDDGGSCIDGRLTSAWNWCSKIASKPYYHAFLLAGFSGFNGEWGKEG